MFGWIGELWHTRRANPNVGLIDGVELVAQAEGTLVVRPVLAILGIEQFQHMLFRIEDAKPRSFDRIHFDFSAVRELAGPWGAHFAMLIHFAMTLDVRVSLDGLQRQPAAIARLFRRCPQIRALLSQPQRRYTVRSEFEARCEDAQTRSEPDSEFSTTA